MEKIGLQPSHHKTNTYMNPHTTLTMLEYYGHSGLIITSHHMHIYVHVFQDGIHINFLIGQAQERNSPYSSDTTTVLKNIMNGVCCVILRHGAGGPNVVGRIKECRHV